jgi:hypothetical protein
MPDIKISQTTPRPALLGADMLPLADPNDPTPYHIKGQTLWDTFPAANQSRPGQVELATGAETRAGADDSRAVTPAGLAGAIDAPKLADAFLYAGQIVGLNRANLSSAFTSIHGRAAVAGDVLTVQDLSNHFYLLVYGTNPPAWGGLDVTTGTWVRYT